LLLLLESQEGARRTIVT